MIAFCSTFPHCEHSSCEEWLISRKKIECKKAKWKWVHINLVSRKNQIFNFLRYNLIYPKKSRFILVLDRSKAMVEYDRWEILHKAINEFITMLPIGSELSIVTFSKNAVMHLPPTLVTETNKLGLYGRLPKRTTYDDEVCLHCAFNVTFKALQVNK